MLWKYPHIPNLLTMKPSPRLLLGRKLFWTIKEDGSCIAIWKDKDIIQISSRNLKIASEDLQNLVKSTEDYKKVLELLKENPNFIVFVEACRKGRSITGITTYDRNILYCFDILDKSSNKFLPYVNVYQHCYHYDIPIVELYAETRHRSMKDLLKFKNHVLEHCNAIKKEGMVIKAYSIPKDIQAYYQEYRKGLLQAKVKLDIPEPTKRKISKGEVILPEIPYSDIMGAIDKVWQEIGTEKFKDKSIAMPLVAKYVNEECKKHLYSFPKKKLFLYYLEYLEKQLKE